VSHTTRFACSSAAWVLVGILLAASAAKGAGPRLLPAGQVPDDRRLGPLKDFDGYFPFTPSKTLEEWDIRAERVRRQLLVATGLWPMPAAAPLNAVVHGRIERPGYTVERVILESYPGHYVTGSLFRPTGKSGRLPAVMCPHGHWKDGRFYDAGLPAVRQQIVNGAERFEIGGRYPLQARCVQLARMGCVVFHYDMVGYADSVQISYELAHRYAKQRPEFDTTENWGFFSTQAELRLQSVLGLQTYNSVRALDWLSGLPDVDPARIAVTGASGGGTQTFLLAAIDPRPAVAFPAVMVSTAMQGGCTCENATLLRVGTGNIEMAGLIAPRPLGMTGADDWTKEIATKGYPELQQLYALYGKRDLVMAKALVQFPHNYNYVSREVMYHWFNKHLKIGQPEPVIEEDFEPLAVAEMMVWNADHPKPVGDAGYERSLLSTMTKEAEQQLASLTPKDADSLAAFRKTVGGAVDVIVGRGLPAAGAIEYQKVDEQDRGTYLEFTAWLRDAEHGERLPTIFLHPKQWNRSVVIWVHPDGKAGLYGADGAPRPEIARLLAGGAAVAAADLLYQGEFLADGKPLDLARKVTNPREFAGFTLGYNHALAAQRAHDLLAVISFCRHFTPEKPDRVCLAAFDGAAPYAAAALAQAGAAVDRAALDTAGFRFAGLRSIRDVNLLPGVVKYGDLPALLALVAPRELWLSGEGSAGPPLTAAAYQAGDKLTLYTGTDDQKLDAAVNWLLR
jgi:dienelactone hydrolase